MHERQFISGITKSELPVSIINFIIVYFSPIFAAILNSCSARFSISKYTFFTLLNKDYFPENYFFYLFLKFSIF